MHYRDQIQRIKMYIMHYRDTNLGYRYFDIPS